MAGDALPPATRILPLIAAAIAFLDTDAAFGPGDQRTLRAKAELRGAADRLSEMQPDPPRLHVIYGGERP
jgi:hypothetical protein